MTLEANFDGVEAWEPDAMGELLPEGRHHVEVTEAKEGKSTGGWPQLEVTLTAVDGPHKGGSIRDWIIFSDNGLGRVKQALEALSGKELPSIAIEAEQVVGKKAYIVVRIDRYGEKETLKVKGYEPESAGAAMNDIPPRDPTPVGTVGGLQGDIPF